MHTFSYKARGSDGGSVSGTVQATDRGTALRNLQREGLVVTDLRAGGRAAVDVDAVRLKQASKQVTRDDVIVLTQQMSVMLETGVPLGEALDAYAKQSKGSGLKRVMQEVRERVTGGAPFSEALGAFPRVFPAMMVTLMQASEASGTMPLMLGRVSEYLAKERRTSKQIKGALTYPAVMVGVAMSVTLFLVVWVLPRFAKIYDSREAALPTMTRVVIDISTVLTQQWPLVAGSVLGVAGGYLYVRSTSWGRRALDVIKVRAPVIGPMFSKYYLTRSMRTLGTLLASGVPLLDAVKIVRGVTDNALWDAFWSEVEHALTQGRTLSEVVLESDLVPPSVGQMIAAGERTGRLGEVLDRVGGTAEEELDEAVKQATQLIEPAMIIFMGLTIGGVAMALLLPIFTISNVVGQ